jgi:hypothetical protein
MIDRAPAAPAMRSRIARLIVGGVIALILPPQFAHGQDDVEPEKKADIARRQQEREELSRLQRLRRQAMYKSQLENWIASRFRTDAGLKDHLETLLAAQLDDLQLVCHLTEVQRKKLQVAGRGDIKRFLDRLDAIRKTMTDMEASEIQNALMSMRDLQEDVEKPFDASSLFSKTLAKTLSPEQLAQHENSLRDKNAVHYREAVNQTVRRLARLLRLSGTQSTALARLILTETTPPTKFGQSDYAFVMFQAARLPEAKLRPIFQEQQWNAIKVQFVSWADSEQTLRDEGFEFIAPPGGTKLDAEKGRSR